MCDKHQHFRVVMSYLYRLMWLKIRQGILKAEIIQAQEQLNMSNYEAVKPLNKTEYLANRQSKKAPPRDRELYHQHSPLKNINIRKCQCQGRWRGSLKANHVKCGSGQQSHAEKATSNRAQRLCEQNVWIKGLRPAFWCGGLIWGLNNTGSCGERFTWFPSCSQNRTFSLAASADPSCVKDCKHG